MSADLFEVIEQHDLDRLAELLSSGSNPNTMQAEKFGWRPLHSAIEELEWGGSIEALALLLRYGAAVDGWDSKQDATPLLMALFRRQQEAALLFLAAGADTNVISGEGDSPLRWCVEQDDYKMAAMLLRFGAKRTIDAAGGPSGMTALGRAASQLNIPIIELLMNAGADPAALDSDYRTARDRLPPQEESDPQAWEAAMALLEGRPHRTSDKE